MVIYVNAGQVERIVVQKFELGIYARSVRRRLA
jgi:hypothetical protein